MVSSRSVKNSLVRIDGEFKSHCPPITESEFSLLRESIKSHGILHPIAIWDGVVLDGHNRLEIAQELGIEVPVVSIELSGREDALQWILKNQLGRRNLSRIQVGYLRGKYYLSVKQSPGRKGKGVSVACKGDDKQIADIVGKMFCVSRCTIMADASLSKAIDSLSVAAKEVVLSGKVTTYASYIRQLAAIPLDMQEEAAEKISAGKKNAIGETLQKFADCGGEAFVTCVCGTRYKVGSRCMRCAQRSSVSVSKALGRQVDSRDLLPVIKGPAAHQSDQVDHSGWQERLAELRSAGKKNNDLTFYVNYVLMWLEEHDEPDEFELEQIEKVVEACGRYMKKHSAAV